MTNINGDNSSHVVLADGTTGTPITKTTVLDGFTITGGQADGGISTDYSGGGFYCFGGGSGNECSPRLRNVTFSGNSASDSGGAMRNSGSTYGNSSPSLIDVKFLGNSAGNYGGAMTNSGSEYGNSNPYLRNVTFSGNHAGSGAGAMYNGGWSGTSNPRLINVAFSGNSAGNQGGAMYNYADDQGNSNPKLINVTFSGNSADNGGAIYSYSGSGIINIEIHNSILWNNTDSSGTRTISATIYNENATYNVTHSLLQGSFPMGSWIGGSYVNGGGNIDKDPQFITEVDPATAPWTDGNLRLQSNSPALDSGENAFVISVSTDLDGEARIIDGNIDGTPTVDMGAYEYQIPYIYDKNLPLVFR